MALMAAHNVTLAQNSSMQGRAFWVTFFQNYGGTGGCNDNSNPQLKIVISCDQAASGTVSNPVTKSSFSFSIGSGGGVDTVLVPVSQAYLTASESNAQKNRGLFVQSNVPVSVSAYNIKTSSFDASLVLPEEALETDYYILSHPGDPYGNNFCFRSCFALVATEDSTTVDITPSCATAGGKTAGSTFSIELNKGESYLVMAGSNKLDLSGTLVKARHCKRIAVFGGAGKSAVLYGSCAVSYDHLYEQLIPIRHWGYRYISLPSLYAKGQQRKAEMIKVVAAYSSTAVRCNGRTKFLTNPGQSDTFYTTTDAVIVASKPIAVAQFDISSACDQSTASAYADPMMVCLSPVTSFLNAMSIGVDKINTSDQTFINILTLTAFRDSFKIDGLSPTFSWKKVLKDSSYSYLQMDSLTSGKHDLHSSYGFSAVQYTYNNLGAYGFNCGFSARTPTLQPMLNSAVVYGPEVNACPYAPLNFDANAFNPAYSVWQWQFLDGQDTVMKSTQNFAYNYRHSGLSKVRLVARKSNNGLCNGEAYSYDSILYAVKVLEGVKPTYSRSRMSACKDSVIRISVNSIDQIKANTYFWVYNYNDTVYHDSAITRPLKPHNSFVFSFVDSQQCVGVDTFLIDALNTGQAQIESDRSTKVCADSTIRVWVSAADLKNAASYFWIYNHKDSILQNDSLKRPSAGNDIFELVLTDTNACINRDTMAFESIKPPDFNFASATGVCLHDTLVLAPAVFTNYFPLKYQWTLNDTLTKDSGDNFSLIGRYDSKIKLSVSNPYGCSHADTISVRLWPLPVFSILSKSEYSEKDSVFLSIDKVLKSYDWFNGAGGRDNRFLASALGQPGNYLLWCLGTDSNGCKNSDTVEIVLKKSSGVQSLKLNGVSIYPNPANSILHIDLKQPENISIISPEGKTVIQLELKAGINDISLNEFSPGLYMVLFNEGTFVFLRE